MQFSRVRIGWVVIGVDLPYDGMDGDDLMKIKNNTIIGTDPGQDQEEMLRGMLNKNMINLPGQTPMNT